MRSRLLTCHSDPSADGEESVGLIAVMAKTMRFN
jgi:hypothetical protein